MYKLLFIFSLFCVSKNLFGQIPFPSDSVVPRFKRWAEIGNVDNTTDMGKPVSIAQAASIANKVNISDTANMLNKYMRDTSRTNIYAAINGKQPTGSYVNVSDTSNMLIPYARSNIVAATYATITAMNLKAALISPSFTTPSLGAATATSIAATGNITSSSGSIGYATGAGGTVTQATSRTTGVTINKISGAITTNNTSLAAGAEVAFTVTNSTVAVGDVILLSARSGQTSGTSIPFVTAVAAGSFQITLSNFHASTADTGAMIINFIVLKSVSN